MAGLGLGTGRTGRGCSYQNPRARPAVRYTGKRTWVTMLRARPGQPSTPPPRRPTAPQNGGDTAVSARNPGVDYHRPGAINTEQRQPNYWRVPNFEELNPISTCHQSCSERPDKLFRDAWGEVLRGGAVVVATRPPCLRGPHGRDGQRAIRDPPPPLLRSSLPKAPMMEGSLSEQVICYPAHRN
jgi:hypothetical protein